jgi:DNA-directed RNA polymerase specialized sigma24 family protein
MLCARMAGSPASPTLMLLTVAAVADPDSEQRSSGLLILADAVARFQHVAPAAAAVVRLRYSASLSVEDTAAALGVATPTVKRAWAFAPGWLRAAIERGRC